MIQKFCRTIDNSFPRVVFSYFGEPMYKVGSEAEQSLDLIKDGSSRGRPPRNSRDTQVLLCTFAGFVIGCAAGAVIGINTWGGGGAVVGAIGGFLIGGITGSFAGEYLKRRKYKKLERQKLDDINGQGPILS